MSNCVKAGAHWSNKSLSEASSLDLIGFVSSPSCGLLHSNAAVTPLSLAIGQACHTNLCNASSLRHSGPLPKGGC